MRHWAAKLIGLEYADVGACWGLVQKAYLARHGVEMPQVLGSLHTAARIRHAAYESGYRPADAGPEEDDIVLMTDQAGLRHVGIMVAANGKLGMLHARGSVTPRGPIGSVVWEELRDTPYSNFQFWRRT